MRVLRLHTAYAHEGGEDHSVRAEVTLLQRGGYRVSTFFRSNDDLVRAGFVPTVSALWRTPFDRRLYWTVRRICRAFRPQVAHADNLWFALSPSVHAACHHEGVPTVQTLRNYRLLCLNGLLLRGGRPCEACVGQRPWAGIRHRCYRGSAFLSTAVARMIQVNRRRGTWDRDVDLFVTPSTFARSKFIESGMAADAIVVKPNFTDDPGPPEPPGRGAVYVGRLVREKGVRTLLEAWRGLNGVPLAVVGDGPERAGLEESVRSIPDARVRLHGRLAPEACRRAIRRAAYLVFPSECYETFGRVVIEAYAAGRAVVAAGQGAALDLVEDGRTGLLFEPGNAVDLAGKIAWLEARPGAVRTLGQNARRAFERRFTPERNLAMLRNLYGVARRRFADRCGGEVAPAASAWAQGEGPTG